MRVILSPSGSSSFVDLLRPPMKAGGRTDQVGALLQGQAAGELGILQVVDRGEMAVWRLIRTVLVSGHRCSAGCNSGEYGGRKSKWTCSGTRRCTLVGFQPARSSTSTICFVGLAPTCCAKAANSTSKSGMLTVVAR